GGGRPGGGAGGWGGGGKGGGGWGGRGQTPPAPPRGFFFAGRGAPACLERRGPVPRPGPPARTRTALGVPPYNRLRVVVLGRQAAPCVATRAITAVRVSRRRRPVCPPGHSTRPRPPRNSAAHRVDAD